MIDATVLAEINSCYTKMTRRNTLMTLAFDWLSLLSVVSKQRGHCNHRHFVRYEHIPLVYLYTIS